MTISYAYDPELSCPECDQSFDAQTWVILDEHEQPSLWDQCRNDTIHCYQCPRGHAQRIQAPLLLHVASRSTLLYSPAPLAPDDQAGQDFVRLASRAWTTLPEASRKSLRHELRVVKRELLPSAMAGAEQDDIKALDEIHTLTSTPPRPEDEEQRIEMLEYALSLFDTEDAPMLWATFAGRLAEILRRSVAGDRADNLEQAIRISDAVLTELSTHNEPIRVAIAEMNLAVLFADRVQGNAAENRRTAIALFERARHAFRPRLLPQYCAVASNNVATQYLKGDPATRAADIESAIAALIEGLSAITPRAEPGHWGDLNQHLGIAYFHRVVGDAADNIERSIAAYHEALRTRTKTAAPHNWVLTQMDLGNALLVRVSGDPAENIEQAVHTYAAAAEFALQKGYAFDWARLQYDLCNAYLKRRHGDRAENAAKSIEAGTAALREITPGSHPDDWGNIQQNVGNAYVELSRLRNPCYLDQAIDAYEKALSVRSPLKSRADWLATIDSLSGAYADRGGHEEDFERLQALMDEAVEIGRDSVPPRFWAQFLVNLATAYPDRKSADRAANRARAVKAYRQAIEIAAPMGLYEVLRLAVVRLALLRGETGEWEQAYHELTAVAAQLERAYAGAVTEEGKERTADSNWFFYQRLIEACVQTSRLREAFLRAEEGSSRSLRDELARVSLPAPGLPKPLVAEESALLERLRVIDLTLRATDDTDGRAQLINELCTVQERISAIWQEMESHPEAAPYLQLRRGERLGWDQLQGWFSEQPQPSAFVEFLDLGTRWIALVVTTGDAEPRVVELDLPEPLLLELVTNYTTALSEGREVAGSAAAELANRLLVPLAAHLCDIPVVCFIPQGLLHHVPLHALAYQSGPLAESVVVHYAPSAAVAIRRKAGPWPGLRASNLVTVGNPTGDLPFADLEATSIARRFSCSPLIGDAASAPRVSAELARADAAHIAAHAWFDWGDPLASGILLAGNTVFNARDAMGQKLRLRLLVLSACSTGQQMVSVGNSLAGLARGFLYAGVQQLVLSLWPVNDMSTMLLMDEFYASLDQGLAVGEALRRAQSYLRNATNGVIVARLAAERRRPSAERILDDEQASALWRRFVLQDPTLRPFEHPHHWAPFFVTGSL